MKHLRIKTKHFQRAALTLLLAVAGIANASADDWMGNSAIYVNGTWYYCGNSFSWCSGGGFNNAVLRIFGSSLKLAGQSQYYTGGSDWGDAKVTMHYIMDNGQEETTELARIGMDGNNHKFQSGGSNFTTHNINISNLGTGTHTIKVWFTLGNKNDGTSENGYQATFTVNTLTAVNVDGNYWATFYCGDTSFDIGDNACAYTAEVDGSTIKMHKLGKVIPQNSAVIIVSESASISMSVTNATANVPTNNLLGLDVQLATDQQELINITNGKTLYMLSNKNNQFGFYKFGGSMVPAHKAFLAIAESSNSRGFTIEFEDDGTTGIRTIGQNITVDGNWYSLDGRRLTGKPTEKGVYINNGKKIIIK